MFYMFFIFFFKKKGLSFRIILSCKGNWVFLSLSLSLSLSHTVSYKICNIVINNISHIGSNLK